MNFDLAVVNAVISAVVYVVVYAISDIDGEPHPDLTTTAAARPRTTEAVAEAKCWVVLR